MRREREKGKRCINKKREREKSKELCLFIAATNHKGFVHSLVPLSTTAAQWTCHPLLQSRWLRWIMRKIRMQTWYFGWCLIVSHLLIFPLCIALQFMPSWAFVKLRKLAINCGFEARNYFLSGYELNWFWVNEYWNACLIYHVKYALKTICIFKINKATNFRGLHAHQDPFMT